MSASGISCVVKAAGALGPTTLPPPRVEMSQNFGSLNLVQTVQVLRDSFTFTHVRNLTADAHRLLYFLFLYILAPLAPELFF